MQVAPFGVRFLDQLQLPLSRPSLQAGFALDGIHDQDVLLVPNGHRHVIPLHELGAAPLLVKHNAFDEVARNAEIERPVALARHDIDIAPPHKVMLTGWMAGSSPAMTEVVQWASRMEHESSLCVGPPWPGNSLK